MALLSPPLWTKRLVGAHFGLPQEGIEMHYGPNTPRVVVPEPTESDDSLDARMIEAWRRQNDAHTTAEVEPNETD